MLVHALTLISVVVFALLIGWRRGGPAAGLYLSATAMVVLITTGFENLPGLFQFVFGLLIGMPPGATDGPELPIETVMGVLVVWQVIVFVLMYSSLLFSAFRKPQDDANTGATHGEPS